MTRREIVSSRGDTRYESDDVGRSLTQDRRKHAATPVNPGHGDRGDQRRH